MSERIRIFITVGSEENLKVFKDMVELRRICKEYEFKAWDKLKAYFGEEERASMDTINPKYLEAGKILLYDSKIRTIKPIDLSLIPKCFYILEVETVPETPGFP